MSEQSCRNPSVKLPASTPGSDFRGCPAATSPQLIFLSSYFYLWPPSSTFLFCSAAAQRPGCEAAKHSGACTDPASSPSASGWRHCLSLAHTRLPLYSQCPHPQEKDEVPSQLEVFLLSTEQMGQSERVNERAGGQSVLQKAEYGFDGQT